MSLLVRVPLIVVSVLLAACASAPLSPLGREVEWLEEWVRGTATFEFDAAYHEEYPRSPHAEDARDFEVAAKALALRGEEGRVRRLALLGTLGELWRVESPVDTGIAERSVRLAGYLADPSGLPLLERAVTDPRVRVHGIALEALGRFSRVRREDTFHVFGGRRRFIVFPEAPSAQATEILLRQVVDLMPADGAWAPLPGEEGPDLDRALLFRAALDALRRQIGSPGAGDGGRAPGAYELQPR